MQIGLGTAAIGRPQYINIRGSQESKTFDLDVFRQNGIDLLEHAYKSGIRYFDTAPGYGMAEQMIMDWLDDRNLTDLEIATKWGYRYTANFDPNADVHEIKDHSITLLDNQWSHSRQLIPQLTTLQIHSATFESGVLTNKAILTRLAEIKNGEGILIGMTSSGPNQAEVIKYALDILVEGNQLFDEFQVTYNMLDQSLFQLTNELSERRIIVKEALANGRIFRNKNYPNYKALYDSLERIATKYRVGVDAVALRFCIDSIQPYAVLSGASNLNQLNENLKASNFQLDDHDIDELMSHSLAPRAYWDERKQLSWN